METTVEPLIVIVGPTASGKSDLAIHIAQKYKGEIICADSQTIRRDMNIGTAKPSKHDQKLIPHHLLDIIGPYDKFSAVDFQKLANKAIKDISKTGKMPILAGGSGLYIDSVLFSYAFRGKTDEELRLYLNDMSVEELQAMIHAAGYKMPQNYSNPRHLIRTIESEGYQPTAKPQRSNTLVLGLDIDKATLNERIAKRIDNMLEQGFIDEVKWVINKYGIPPKNFDAIGYKIVLSYINEQGKADEDSIKRAMNIADRRYAKRQKAWFKRNPNIQWITSKTEADKLIKTFLSKFATIGQ